MQHSFANWYWLVGSICESWLTIDAHFAMLSKLLLLLHVTWGRGVRGVVNGKELDVTSGWDIYRPC